MRVQAPGKPASCLRPRLPLFTRSAALEKTLPLSPALRVPPCFVSVCPFAHCLHTAPGGHHPPCACLSPEPHRTVEGTSPPEPQPGRLCWDCCHPKSDYSTGCCPHDVPTAQGPRRTTCYISCQVPRAAQSCLDLGDLLATFQAPSSRAIAAPSVGLSAVSSRQVQAPR